MQRRATSDENQPRGSLDHTSKRARSAATRPPDPPEQQQPALAGAAQLPHELLSLVLDNLSPVERINSAALVCKRWAAVALDPARKGCDPTTLRLKLPSKWRMRDDLEQNDLLTGLERLVRIRHGGRTRTLHIARWDLEGDGEQEVQIFSALLSLFPRLDRLYLYACFKGYAKQDRVLQLISCYCPALKYLQWSVLLYNPKNMPQGVVLPTVKEVRTGQALSPSLAQDVSIHQLLEVFPGLALLKS